MNGKKTANTGNGCTRTAGRPGRGAAHSVRGRACGMLVCACLLSTVGAHAETPAQNVPRADRFETALLRGQAAMEDGLYDVAERQFSRALERAGDEAAVGRATAWLARAFLAQHRPRAAIEAIRASFGSVRAEAYAADLLFWLARAYADAGDADEAGSVMDARLQMLAEGSVLPREDLRLLAGIRVRQGRAEEALAAFLRFDEVYGEGPDGVENRLDWARFLQRNGRYEEAAARFTQVIEGEADAPAAMTARLALARIRLDAGDGAGVEQLVAPLHGDAEAPPDLRAEALLLLAHAARAGGDAAQARLAAAAAGAAGDPDGAGRARLFEAHLEIDEGRLDDAARLLQAALSERPDDPDAGKAMLRLSDALRRAGRVAEALAGYQRLMEIHGEAAMDAAALLGRAWCYWDMGAFEDAAPAFQRYADRAPEGAGREEAFYKAGDALYAAGRMAEAADAYEAFTTRFPESALAGPARLQAAAALVETGAFPEAVALYERIEQAHPGSDAAARASLSIGRTAEHRHRWNEALAAYGRTLDRYPEHAVMWEALLGRGLVRYRLGAFQEALQDFDALVAGEAAARLREQGAFMRGWCLYLLGDESGALAVGRGFAEQFPGSDFSPGVLFWLGEQAFNRADWPEAERIFVQLATNYPGHELAARALYWAGRSAAGGREFVRAIEHYGRLAREHGESPMLSEARFTQGDALSELGRFDDAILAYREVILRDPEGYLAERAIGRIGDCHFTLAAEDPRRYADALRRYQEVLDRPGVPLDLQLQAEYKIGRCLEHTDRVDEAFERYMNVVYGHLAARRDGRIGSPFWFARAGFTAGMIQERRGRWREAVAVYRRVAEAGGSAAEEAQERILRIRRENWRIY